MPAVFSSDEHSVWTRRLKGLLGITILATSGFVLYRAQRQRKQSPLPQPLSPRRQQRTPAQAAAVRQAAAADEADVQDVLSPAVRSVLRRVGGYMVGGLAITGSTMLLAGPHIGTGGQLAGLIATVVGVLGVKLLPTKQALLKHIYYASFTIGNGLMLAPLSVIGGPILLPVLALSSGMTIGLAVLAMSVQKRSLLYLHGPLVAGSSILLVSSLLDTLFASPTHGMQMNLFDSIRLYGGLLLFGGYILFDIQSLITRTEHVESSIRDAFRAQRNGAGVEGMQWPGVGFGMAGAEPGAGAGAGNRGPVSGGAEMNDSRAEGQAPSDTWQNAYESHQSPVINLAEEQQVVSATVESVDVISESVEFYLDFVSIALRILELYLRSEEEEQRRKRRRARQN